MTIFETLKRMQRLPRTHRIAFLKSLLKLEKPRSVRAVELGAALKREMNAQIKFEIRQGAAK